MFANFDWVSFFFGGVIIAFLVNILSNFAQRKIDNLLGNISSKRRAKNEENQQILETKAKYLRNNPHEELIFHIRQINNIIYSCAGLIMMVLALTSTDLIKELIILIVGLTFFIIGSKESRKYIDLTYEIINPKNLDNTL